MNARRDEQPSPIPSTLSIALPDWVADVADTSRRYAHSRDRVALAIELARQNVERGTGGPFGAAVFDDHSGELIAVGVNLVTPLRNSALHAEVVALMLAQQARASHTLATPPGVSPLVLATSCAPCAMCLGAVHWSGVTRVLIGASRADATEIGFDEGPVFPESIAYLERAGIAFEPDVERDAARAVLQRYVALNRPVYNS